MGPVPGLPAAEKSGVQGNEAKTMGIPEILDQMDKVGYKDMKVHEIVSQLAGLGPNIPVFAIEHEGESEIPLFVTGFTLDSSGRQPILFIHTSENPEKIRTVDELLSHDEKVAVKRNQAIEMHKNSEAASKI